jgi:hypothetical protein
MLIILPLFLQRGEGRGGEPIVNKYESLAPALSPFWRGEGVM